MLDPYLGCGREVQRRDYLPGKNNVFVLWYLEATTWFRCCGFVRIGVGGPCVAPVVWFWSSVSVCVSSGDVSLLHSKSHLWTFQTLLITTIQCLYITWFFPQLSHSSCLVHIHFPHVKKVLRTVAQALDPPMLKSQTENLGVFPVWLPWTPKLHLSLSIEILVMEQGVPASVFLPGGTRAPQVQTVPIVVRGSQWSGNPEQIEADYHQLWHGPYCERDWHPPGQFTDLRAVSPGLDSRGQICWC